MCVVLELALHAIDGSAKYCCFGCLAYSDVVVVANADVLEGCNACAYVPREFRLLQFPACLDVFGSPASITHIPGELRSCGEIHAGKAAEADGVFCVDGE